MIHSFLLMGQSNMAGRGFLKEAAPIRDTHIKMLRNGRWQVMSEPVNCDRPFAGINLSASFAWKWRQRHPEEEIGLIPCADGGSSLDEWMPGEVLFDHAVFQAQLAQRTSRIEGILWHQGENDCPPERLGCYEEKLERMIRELRSRLELSSVPFLIGGLGDYLPDCTLHDYFVNAPRFNEMLLHYAQTHENCYFVTAAGLQPNPDLLHFNAVSLRRFGLRYLAAYEGQEHVLAPLQDEAEILHIQQEYAEMTAEEKAALLKRQLEQGQISRQEYDYRMDAVIRAL